VSQTLLIIGSRGSALALWQAHYVAGRLKALGVETRLEIIKTTGDFLQSASLTKAGGKGLFTKEIEEALVDGRIDLAVHSLKDLPTQHPEGLTLAAIPEREDPRDALVGHTLRSLPAQAHVGTSSLRRSAQLMALRPDLRITPIRGNVDTRLRKLKEGQFDAIMLAAAGLRRLGLSAEIAQLLSADEICPAPGQGALGIQTRVDGEAQEICALLNHAESEQAVTAERTVLAALGGGCQLPVGAYAAVSGDTLQAVAAVSSPDGKTLLRDQESGLATQAQQIGEKLATKLLQRGAAEILQAVASNAL
jgi:hydroxymethylbilane synthase